MARAPGRGRGLALIRDGFGLLSIVLGLLLGIAWIAPGGGQVTGALHDALAAALGQAGILLPALLFLAGIVVIVRAVAPNWRPPAVRLIGLFVVLAMVPPVLRLADVITNGGRAPDTQTGGLLGRLISDALIGALGPVGAVAVVAFVVIAGILIFIRVSPMQVVRGIARISGGPRRRPPGGTPTTAGPPQQPAQPPMPRPEGRLAEGLAAPPPLRNPPPPTDDPPTRSASTIVDRNSSAPEAQSGQSERPSSLDLRNQRNGVPSHGLPYPSTPRVVTPGRAINPGIETADEGDADQPGHDDATDAELYERAAELAEKVGRVSVSLLQRRLGIGAGRAQQLMDRLIEDGLAEA